MESEEITKLVDGVYKNILEKFNPGARQLITAGKNYLKTLHGAATSARLFNEALAKIAMNAQHSGTSDIGVALLNVVSVHKEIQEQQMNILKAFYVDLLVPLETNLEKDTKVVQHEQKKFLQQHKVRMESYHKAVSTMKKQRKKKSSPENTEKELRILEDQKKKLDSFCEQSYKNAMTQERRRYGFVLERQCSIAKHWMAYHTTGKTVIDNQLENWQEIAASREILPSTVYDGNSLMVGNKRLERLKDSEDSRANGISANILKKSRSIDAPYGDMRNLHDTSSSMAYTQNSLPRAKSDFNLNSSGITNSTALVHSDHTDNGHWMDQRTVVKALYAYMPSGENQLPFEEGDRIALVGSKAKGWQFGENIRTQMFGWFPIAYTNADLIVETLTKSKMDREMDRSAERYENMHFSRGGGNMNGSIGNQIMRHSYHHDQYIEELQNELESDSAYNRRSGERNEETSPTRMFGDTYRNQQKKYRPSAAGNPRPGPPPTLPAPVPSSTQAAAASRLLNTSQSFCAPNGSQSAIERRKQKLQNGNSNLHNRPMLTRQQQTTSMTHLKPAAAAKTSLHSSNDSGFANEPPPQPEVDYSDEEQSARVPIRRRAGTNSHISPNREITSSWTLNRNFRTSVDGQLDEKDNLKTMNRSSGKMRYDLIASDDEILQASSSGIKRTKSFWKFGGRAEDILAGMSLWQHRDLVAAPNMDELRDEGYRTTSSKMESEREMDKSDTLRKSNHSASSQEKGKIASAVDTLAKPARKDSITSMEMYDDDENIYGLTPMVREPMIQRNSNNNYTPKSRMKIMKTIEIDIENPTESERLNTIKRNQKEFRESQMAQQQQQQQQQQSSGGNRNSMMEKKQNQRASERASNQRKQNNSGQQQQQQKAIQQQQHRSKHSEVFPSTESEAGDSELDNGTLKMSDVNNFFDGNESPGGIIMKTVKRKDILKQYYTSEDDSDEHEIKSTSSDPYDCIVINDHLVRRDEKHRRAVQQQMLQEQQMEFQTFRASATSNTLNSNGNNTKRKSADQQERTRTNKQQQQQQQREQEQARAYSDATLTRHMNNAAPTATILPRTRLMKSSSSNITSTMTLERNSSSNTAQKSMMNSNHNNSGAMSETRDSSSKHYGKTYGPWYDFWDQEEQQQQQQQQQQSKSSNKMK